MGVLENQGGIGGQIAARLVGMAWSLVTFLAVPVIAIEGTGPIETLKRSASIFSERWGQQITGNIAIGGAVVLLGVLPAAIADRRRRRRSGPRRSFLGALLVVIGALGAGDRAADLQGAQRDLRRRPVPLRARRPGGRRLHRRGAGVGGEAAEGGRKRDATPGTV